MFVCSCLCKISKIFLTCVFDGLVSFEVSFDDGVRNPSSLYTPFPHCNRISTYDLFELLKRRDFCIGESFALDMFGHVTVCQELLRFRAKLLSFPNLDLSAPIRGHTPLGSPCRARPPRVIPEVPGG
jgi:hypothetical protein